MAIDRALLASYRPYLSIFRSSAVSPSLCHRVPHGPDDFTSATLLLFRDTIQA